jgi:hypothetical protein
MDDRQKWIADQIAKGSKESEFVLGQKWDALQGTAQKSTTTTTPTPAQTLTADQAKSLTATILSELSKGSTVANPIYGSQVSPSQRQAIGVTGTQYYDPTTGQPTAYSGFMAVGAPVVTGGPPRIQQNIQPSFFEGDEDQLRRQSPEQIAATQSKMVKSGLLKSGTFKLGLPDDQTISAYKNLLGWSNTFGVKDPQATLSKLVQTGGVGTNVGVQKYVTNATDLKSVFDKAAQSVLGRTLDDPQLEKLVFAYQQQEKAPTSQTTVTGVKTKEPTASTFGVKNIETMNQDEADAYKFSQYAQVLDRMLGG